MRWSSQSIRPGEWHQSRSPFDLSSLDSSPLCRSWSSHFSFSIPLVKGHNYFYIFHSLSTQYITQIVLSKIWKSSIKSSISYKQNALKITEEKCVLDVVKWSFCFDCSCFHLKICDSHKIIHPQSYIYGF